MSAYASLAHYRHLYHWECFTAENLAYMEFRIVLKSIRKSCRLQESLYYEENVCELAWGVLIKKRDLNEKGKQVTVCYKVYTQTLGSQGDEQSSASPNYNSNQFTSPLTRLSPTDSTHNIENTAPSLLPNRRAQAYNILAATSICGCCINTSSSATRALIKGKS